MNLKKTISIGMAVLALSAIGIAKTQDKDIVDTAIAAGKFTTLTKLVTDAGLVDTLKGAGPYTVLAPTDDAFAAGMKRMPTQFDKITADKELLKKVLLYHVIKGNVLSTDLKDGADVDTVEGEKLKVHITDGKVSFGAGRYAPTVTTADVKASNGTIHIISGVLIPPSVRKQLRPNAAGVGQTTTPTTPPTTTGGGSGN